VLIWRLLSRVSDVLLFQELYIYLYVSSAAKATGNQGLFNNAAQVWNHTFYWNCMKQGGGGAPTGKVLEAINTSFGSYENFRKEFEAAAVTAFGSAWAWLVWTPSGLKITKTSNAETPLTDEGVKALLTVDVWEHAYYIDYQNLRPDYVANFMNHLVNWEFVESQLP
jgi:Fe-Mn family superoxide dismutase